ncbi:MAG TPA: hypothetical protein VL966_05615 [Alphaproteobacteria bacterium]|nr:hypothetical protein [Alphaproteobacteria bacterium]
MSVSRVVGGRLSALALPMAAGAILGLALACVVAPIRWDDQSFYTWMAPRLLDGYRLYGADLQDTNPPLIAWINILPTLLARATGATPHASFVAFVTALAVGAIVWSLRLARSDRRASEALPWLAVLLVYATVILPSVWWKLSEISALGMGLRYDFGQREHFLVLLVLPYLFAAARRLAGEPLPGLEALAVGLVAALGFCIKPQYLTVVAAVEAVIVVHARSLRPLVRPELVALVLGGLVYCAIVWLVTPGYFAVIPTFAAIYGDFGHQTAWQIMLLSKYHFAVAAAAVLGLVLLRGAGAMRPAAAVVLAAGIAAFAAFLLQAKGWTDHLLPADTFITVAIGLALIGRDTRSAPDRRGPVMDLATAAIAGASCLVALAFYYPARAAEWADSVWAHHIAAFNAATAAYPPGTGFLILSEAIYSQYDIAMDRGFVWASRYPFLILPEETIRAERTGDDARHSGYPVISDVLGASGRRGPDARQYATMLRRQVVEDFERWKPAIVLVQRCGDPVMEPCLFGEGFRVVDWLKANPAFSAIWSHYAFDRSLWRFDLYLLKGSGPH